MVQLSKIARITSGGTPNRKEKEYWEGGSIPWVTTSLVNFNIIKSAEEYITDIGLENSSAKLFPKGTLIMAIYGQGLTRGKVAILGVDASTNQACLGFIIRDRIADTVFTFYSLQNQYQKLRNLSNEGSQKNLSGTLVKSFPIPLPPLPEQQKIAAILSTWDRAIALTRQLLQEKEAQKKGLMQRLLTGKVRVKGFDNELGVKKTVIGSVPKDWYVRKAGKIFRSVSTKKNGQKPLLAVTQENGVVDRSDLEGRVTMPSGSTASYKLVQPGNFVISLRSFQGGLEYSNIEGIVSPAYIVLENIIDIDTQYFRYYFKSAEFISRLAVAVIGIRDGKQISYKDFSALSLRLPQLKEQTAIAAILTQADEEIRLLREKEQALQSQKKGLMQRLLTGKIRVKP